MVKVRDPRRPLWNHCTAGKRLASFCCLGWVSACFWAAPLPAQTNGSALAERIQALERQVAELSRRVGPTSTGGRQAGAPSEALLLEARVSALESQVQQFLAQFPSPADSDATPAFPLRLVESAANAPTPQASVPPLRKLETPAPGSGEMRLPVAGYMELNFSKPREQSATFDFRRFVLLFGHSFSERLKFWSELELEHALVEGREEKGELELEQAYLDFLLHPALNFRGGMLLTPMGIINERHEPPSFYSVLRPQVDTVIIPSTWFDTGVGVFGDWGKGLSYKFYGMSPLNAAEFNAEEGLRGGRQKGSQSFFQNWAQALRFEYRGVPRLVLGTSFWNGRAGFDLRTVHPVVRIAELDGRYRWNRFEFRGEFATAYITKARELNLALQRRGGIHPNVARQIRGFYWEGAAHLFPRASKHDLVGFLRYENFDTQYRMPRGFLPLKQFDRSLWTFGASYYPHPDIALKADYQVHRNESTVVKTPHQFNLGLGWWF